MNPIIAKLKGAPKWAWWTTGGLVIGVVALKVYGNRDASPKDSTAADGSTVGDTESGSTQPATTGSSPPGVIVPPIITGGGDGSSAEAAGAISGLMGGILDDLSGMLGTVITGDQAVLAGVIAGDQERSNAIIDLLANGGPPPRPATVNGTIVVTQKPPAAKPPRQGGGTRYPTWQGHTLWWWRQPAHARKNGKWRWPGGGGYDHNRAFEGHSQPSGHTTNPHK